MGYGMLGHVMWNFQDSMGTSQQTSLHAIPVTEESLVFGIDPIAEAGMYGRLHESPYHEGLHSVNGNIGMEAHPIAMGWLLRSALDAPTTTSDTGKQSHVFKPRTADFDARAAADPATIEVYRDIGSAAHYYDCFGGNLDINIANGELVTLNLGIVGAGFIKDEKASPTFPTAKAFIWDQVSAQFNSAIINNIADLTISINNNLEPVYTLTNTKTPFRVKRSAQQMIELNGTLIFEQWSYFQAFEDQSELSLVIYIKGQETPYEITFDFPAFRFKTFEPVMGGAGLIEAPFTAGAMYHNNSATTMEVTLVNTQTYY